MLSGILTSLVTILIVGGIAYLIFRPKDHDIDHQSLKDAYFFFIAFIGLWVVFWAVSDFIRVVLEENVFRSSLSTYSTRYYVTNSDAYLRKISLRVSTFLVAFPVYAFHWFKANFKPEESTDIGHKRMYLIAVMILSALLTLGTGTALVYMLINAILGVISSSNNELAYLIPYSIAGAVVWVAHFFSYRKMDSKDDNMNVKSAEPKEAGATVELK